MSHALCAIKEVLPILANVYPEIVQHLASKELKHKFKGVSFEHDNLKHAFDSLLQNTVVI